MDGPKPEKLLFLAGIALVIFSFAIAPQYAPIVLVLVLLFIFIPLLVLQRKQIGAWFDGSSYYADNLAAVSNTSASTSTS